MICAAATRSGTLKISAVVGAEDEPASDGGQEVEDGRERDGERGQTVAAQT